MGQNVTVTNQNFKGVQLSNFKLKPSTPADINQWLTSGVDGKISFYNPVSGLPDSVLASTDLAADIAAATGSQVAKAVEVKSYADSKVITGTPVFDETDKAASAAALKAYVDAALAAIGSTLAGGWVVRDDLTLDFTGNPLTQLTTASATTAIKKGDAFLVGVGGAFGGIGYDSGDFLIAKTNAPTLADLSDFHLVEHNIEDATDVMKGVVRLATPLEVGAKTGSGVVSVDQVTQMISVNGFATKGAVAAIPMATLNAAGAAGVPYPHGVPSANCFYRFKGETTGDTYTLGLTDEAVGTVTIYTDVPVTENIIVIVIG